MSPNTATVDQNPDREMNKLFSSNVKVSLEFDLFLMICFYL